MSLIYVIDDDEDLCRTLSIQLRKRGHQVRYATRGEEGLRELAALAPDLVLLDLNLPDVSGLELLSRLQRRDNPPPVAMITGAQQMSATIEAMRSGACDYIRKPLGMEDVLLLLEKVERFRALNDDRSRSLFGEEQPSAGPLEIVGSSREMFEVVKRIGLLSRSGVTVLIEGESGTGKELVARAIHQRGRRPGSRSWRSTARRVAPRPCWRASCSATRRARSPGADRAGSRQASSRPTAARCSSTRSATCRSTCRPSCCACCRSKRSSGWAASEPIPVNVRVVAATHRDLEALVVAGAFREDLFYRLAVARLRLPPLRERQEDLPALVRHLIGRIAHRLHREVEGIEKQAIARMQDYDWPGNVRELENVLTRAVALARGSVLTLEDLDFRLDRLASGERAPEEILPLSEVEKRHIALALTATGWNITRTARMLQVAPNTLRSKIAEYGLRKPL